jgi:hypothetical protein
MLTNGKKKKYLADGGVRCPFCRSENISGGFVEVDGGSAYQEIGCIDCDKAWVDIYDLVDVEEKE